MSVHTDKCIYDTCNTPKLFTMYKQPKSRCVLELKQFNFIITIVIIIKIKKKNRILNISLF